MLRIVCRSRHYRSRAGWAGATLALAFWGNCAGAQTKVLSTETPSVAIFYDGPSQPLAEGYLDARQIQNLLGHFNLTGQIIPISDYQPGQLGEYRAAFFVGTTSGTNLPNGFPADVRASEKPFCWIGRHVDRLVKASEAGRRFGFKYVDYRDDLEFRQVIYKGITLPKEDPELNIISITDPAAVQVLATAVNDEKVRHPYALRQGRFWYIADTPFSYAEEGGRYLVFCDLLHDILEIDHAPQAVALARIEDVSADIDPADLRRIADLLAGRKAPFQVAVIPIFRTPSKGFEVHLSDRPFLVEAIQYMVARGGTPVLHGVTHQYRGQSGDDYEFWDERGNRPIAGDSDAGVRRRLGIGLQECFRNGVFPVAFETPHYAASETDYAAMKAVFTVFNERTMATPDIAAIQFFPYPVVDRFGRYVVPENLGYLPEDDPDPNVLVARAHSLRVVRDAVASFYFHSFLDPALLDEVVRGISGEGYQFVSLRRFGGTVNYRGRYAVSISPGLLSLSPVDEFWRLRLFDPVGKLVNERLSGKRLRGTVEVAVQPPAGGWAVLDCLKAPPKPRRGPEWVARLRQWWRSVTPARRSLAGAGEFTPSGNAWILWLKDAPFPDLNNQQSYRSVLEAFGYGTKTVQPGDLTSLPRDKGTLLVIPEGAAARLSKPQQDAVLRYLEEGGLVVADGQQEWLSRLGFRWNGRRMPVSSVTDVLYPEMPLEWQPEEVVERFTSPEGAQQLMVDSKSRQALALGGEHGRGRYIYLAVPLDPHTPDATSHYPYFAEYLSESFRLRQTSHGPRLEVYFDPSLREGVNLDRLASSWRQSGIRTIYAAAWKTYKNHAFDYASLVRTCHRNGLSVYAWFVLPATTPKMWDEHPEWREKTAAGTDGQVGWRYSMNLQNSKCFRAAMDWMNQTLQAYDWDGVNLTELNFDADFLDYLRPDRFVPMNSDARAEFAANAGFDPVQLFDPSSTYYHKRNKEALGHFLRYREDVVTAWHRHVLSELEPLRRSRGWEVIVTMLDSLHSSYVRPALGVDSNRIVALMKDFDFTLQVEDPVEYWSQEPERYQRFAKTYLKLVPDRRRLMFDVNVVSGRSIDGTSLPSATATGTELARTVLAAASASGRVAIYAESTVPSQDWGLIGSALASGSRLKPDSNGWRLTSPFPTILSSIEDRDYYLDGRLWPAASPDGVVVPAGRHRLSFDRPWYRFLDPGELPARLLHLNADLLDAEAKATGLEVRYASAGRAVLLVNQKPLTVLVDGRNAELPVQGSGERWTVFAPPGEHRVELVTATRTGVAVNVWGWLSASVITAFGALTTILMIVIYSHLRFRRIARRRIAS